MRPITDASFSAATYDVANRMTAMGGNSLTNDADGKITNSPSLSAGSLTWNARNQLISTGGGSTFSYDALGRLVSRTSGGSTNSYLYDGLSQIVANGSITLRGLGVDEVYAQVAAGSAVSYLTDALGSVAMLTNSAQTITTQYSYGAYGAEASTAAAGGPASSVTPFEYTGADFVSSDQLVYLRNRFYSPQLQRFVSEDPIGLGGGGLIPMRMLRATRSALRTRLGCGVLAIRCRRPPWITQPVSGTRCPST